MLEENLTFYDLLDIGPDATPQEIRDAYLRTKSTYTRDSVVLYTLLSAEEREETIQKVEEAYLILSDPDKRRAYDRNHGMFKSYENPFASTTQSLPANIIPIDRSYSMNSAVDGDQLLIPPKTDFEATPTNTPSIPSPPESASPLAETPSLQMPKPETEQRPLEPSGENASNYPSFNPSSLPSSYPSSYNDESITTITPPAPRTAPKSGPPKLDTALLQELENETEWRGSFLKKIREASQISLEEMSGITKVTKSYIVAIEEDNYSKLPATVYIRGFVVQIAKVLKLPHEKVATSYLARVGLQRKA